jgi:hypothetical protein
MADLHLRSIGCLPCKKLEYNGYFHPSLNILTLPSILTYRIRNALSRMIRQEWEQWQSFGSDRREGGHASKVA